MHTDNPPIVQRVVDLVHRAEDRSSSQASIQRTPTSSLPIAWRHPPPRQVGAFALTEKTVLDVRTPLWPDGIPNENSIAVAQHAAKRFGITCAGRVWRPRRHRVVTDSHGNPAHAAPTAREDGGRKLATTGDYLSQQGQPPILQQEQPQQQPRQQEEPQQPPQQQRPRTTTGQQRDTSHSKTTSRLQRDNPGTAAGQPRDSSGTTARQPRDSNGTLLFSCPVLSCLPVSCRLLSSPVRALG